MLRWGIIGMRQNSVEVNPMKIIGITGGIGSGKSEVSRLLSEKVNAIIISTDKVAHQLMNKGQISYERIVVEFGSDILDLNLEIDRVKLGEKVYGNSTNLEKLNSMTHPYVVSYILEEIEELKVKKAELLCIETALPLEAKLKEYCHEIWYIYSSKELRENRLKETRGYSSEKIAQIFNSQNTDENYKVISTHMIVNDGSKEKLVEQFMTLLDK